MKLFKLLSPMNVRTLQMITRIPPWRGGEALVLDSGALHMAFLTGELSSPREEDMRPQSFQRNGFVVTWRTEPQPHKESYTRIEQGSCRMMKLLHRVTKGGTWSGQEIGTRVVSRLSWGINAWRSIDYSRRTEHMNDQVYSLTPQQLDNVWTLGSPMQTLRKTGST